ncbi:MAG TPA: cytochrome c [Thermoanaerobaculia bacterium]|jgi:cytochrome c556|nr:cytochrome c [Thermoanaerobaculia bacterium]
MKRLPLLLILALPLLAADKPEAAIKYRSLVMKAMGAHMNAMSMVVSKQVSDRSRLAVHAEALRGLANGLPALFPKGTGPDVARTAAKLDVWQRWPEFTVASKRLESETARLLQLARGKDAAAFDKQFEAVNAACNECHQQFRVRD